MFIADLQSCHGPLVCHHILAYLYIEVEIYLMTFFKKKKNCCSVGFILSKIPISHTDSLVISIKQLSAWVHFKRVVPTEITQHTNWSLSNGETI